MINQTNEDISFLPTKISELHVNITDASLALLSACMLCFPLQVTDYRDYGLLIIAAQSKLSVLQETPAHPHPR
jgi:hypothetical protein